MKHAWGRADALARSTAALVVGLAICVASGLALALLPGVPRSMAVSLQVLVSFPAWVAYMVYAALARSAARAWAVGVGIAAAAAGLVAVLTAVVP